MQHSKLQSNQLSPVDAIYPQIIHNLHKPICSTQNMMLGGSVNCYECFCYISETKGFTTKPSTGLSRCMLHPFSSFPSYFPAH